MGAGGSTAASCSSLDLNQQAKFAHKSQYHRRNQQQQLSRYKNLGSKQQLLMKQQTSSSHFDLTQSHLTGRISSPACDPSQAEVYSLSNANIGLMRPIKVLPAPPKNLKKSGGVASKLQMQQQRARGLGKFSDSLPMLNNEHMMHPQPQQLQHVMIIQSPTSPLLELDYNQNGCHMNRAQQQHHQHRSRYAKYSNKPAMVSNHLVKTGSAWQPVDMGHQQLKRATSMSSLHDSHYLNQQQHVHCYREQSAKPKDSCDLYKSHYRHHQQQHKLPPQAPAPKRSQQSVTKYSHQSNNGKVNKYKSKQQQQQQSPQQQQQGCPVLPPLPRSQSLHELIQLRATENGQRMRTTGTLRGPLGNANETSPNDQNKVNLVVELLENKRQEKLSQQQQHQQTSATLSSQSSADYGIHDVKSDLQMSSPSTSNDDQHRPSKAGFYRKNEASNLQLNKNRFNKQPASSSSGQQNLKRSVSHSALNLPDDSYRATEVDNDSQEDLNELAKFLYQFKQRQEAAKLSSAQKDSSATGKPSTSNDDGTQQSPNSTTSSSGFASSSCKSNSLRSSSTDQESGQSSMQKSVGKKKYPAPQVPQQATSKCPISGKLKLSSSLLSIVDEYANNSTLNHQQTSQPSANSDQLANILMGRKGSPGSSNYHQDVDHYDEATISSQQLEQLKRYTKLRQMSQSELALNHLTSSSASSAANLSGGGGGKQTNSGANKPYRSKLINLIKRIGSDKSEAGNVRGGGGGSAARNNSSSINLMNGAVGGQQQQQQPPSKTRSKLFAGGANNKKLLMISQQERNLERLQAIRPINQSESGLSGQFLQAGAYSNEPRSPEQGILLFKTGSDASERHPTASMANNDLLASNSSQPSKWQPSGGNANFSAQKERAACCHNGNLASESLCDLNFDCDFELIKNCGISPSPAWKPQTNEQQQQQRNNNNRPATNPSLPVAAKAANLKLDPSSRPQAGEGALAAAKGLIGMASRGESGNWRLGLASSVNRSAEGCWPSSNGTPSSVYLSRRASSSHDAAAAADDLIDKSSKLSDINDQANKLLDELDQSLDLVSDDYGRQQQAANDPADALLWQRLLANDANLLRPRAASDDDDYLDEADYATINKAMLNATFGCLDLANENERQRQVTMKASGSPSNSFTFSSNQRQVEATDEKRANYGQLECSENMDKKKYRLADERTKPNCLGSKSKQPLRTGVRQQIDPESHGIQGQQLELELQRECCGCQCSRCKLTDSSESENNPPAMKSCGQRNDIAGRSHCNCIGQDNGLAARRQQEPTGQQSGPIEDNNLHCRRGNGSQPKRQLTTDESSAKLITRMRQDGHCLAVACEDSLTACCCEGNGNGRRQDAMRTPATGNCRSGANSQAPTGKLQPACHHPSSKYYYKSAPPDEDVKLQPCVNGCDSDAGPILAGSKARGQIELASDNCCLASRASKSNYCQPPQQQQQQPISQIMHKPAGLSGAAAICRSNSELMASANPGSALFGRLRSSLLDKSAAKTTRSQQATKCPTKSNQMKLLRPTSKLHLSGSQLNVEQARASFGLLTRQSNLSSTGELSGSLTNVDFDDNFILKRKTPNAGLNLKSRC